MTTLYHGSNVAVREVDLVALQAFQGFWQGILFDRHP